MSYNKKNVTQVDVKGKKVLLRCDFNVPLDADRNITAVLCTVDFDSESGTPGSDRKIKIDGKTGKVTALKDEF